MEETKEHQSEQESESKVYGYVVGKRPEDQEYPSEMPKNI